jgi:hypothetical protein
MSFRSVVSLATMLCVAPLGLLAAQESTAPINAATTVEVPAPAPVTATPSVPQPQSSPLFQVRDSEPTLGSLENATMAAGGSNHTIVISTLVLVLAVVILVLLIS